MFGTILISACTLMHIYVFWRAASVPVLNSRIPLRLFLAMAVLLWLLLVLGRVFGHGGDGALAGMLEMLGMTWMAVLFLTTVTLLCMDVVTGFGLLLPRFAPRLRGWALAAGLLLSMAALVQGLRPPTVTDYQVSLPGLPQEMEGKVIVALSDLHLGSQLGEAWLSALVDQVKGLHPDMVFLLGDIFEGHGRRHDELVPLLRRLSAPLGSWAVLGNHEFYGGKDSSIKTFQQAGFHLLRDDWVELRPGFILAGVDDLTARRRYGPDEDSLARALTGRPPGATVLLSHTPWETEQAAAAGVNLMLSGHTHGGQIWPFGYLVSLRYPLLAGRYEVGSLSVIVSRGAGTWGPRMRLWKNGEILRITLHRT